MISSLIPRCACACLYIHNMYSGQSGRAGPRSFFRSWAELLGGPAQAIPAAKCTFAQPEVEFCGHVVGGGIVRVLDKKIQTIRDWPAPKNVHQVRQFLGLANYYRQFVKEFGSITAPLTALFKQNGEDKWKNRPVIWNTSCQVPFERLKQALTNAPVLHQPDPTKASTTLRISPSDTL
jgi:hypothetical protein